ncbi:STAS domain-containing protein [Streptomyces sp. I6]|uniref:STAS domain-containing protein n=1 Tax=Streptomyces sp. I6 TaxID=2483113 RepID=UPI002880225E|nr:STAS domain-containing protein [Streptomyces sp. I6]
MSPAGTDPERTAPAGTENRRRRSADGTENRRRRSRAGRRTGGDGVRAGRRATHGVRTGRSARKQRRPPVHDRGPAGPRSGHRGRRGHGELDHDTAEPLRSALGDAVAGGARRIVVDCAELRFCDSTGLNVLLRARLAAQGGDARVELAALRPQVARMLAVTGAAAVFPRYASLGEALATPRQE